MREFNDPRFEDVYSALLRMAQNAKSQEKYDFWMGLSFDLEEAVTKTEEERDRLLALINRHPINEGDQMGMTDEDWLDLYGDFDNEGDDDTEAGV